MSATRRVYFYVISIITLGIFAAGAGQLLSLLFDISIKASQVPQVGRATFNQQQLSLGLALLVIGGPLWFFFWRAIQRRVVGNQEEIGAGIRKFFLNIIILVSALVGLTSAQEFLRWLISGVPVDRFSSAPLAALIITAAIWSYHWRISESEGHPSPVARTLRRWHVYIMAGVGLVWIAVNPVQLINVAVVNLPIWQGTLARGPFWNDTTQSNVAGIVLGLPVWYFHWLRMARGDFESTLRQVYFYLLTIMGGAIAALVALTVSLYQFLVWALGAATVPGNAHFQFLGWTIPTILVGAAVWGYHHWLAQEEAIRVKERQLSAQRVHFYLMSFLGLGTMVAGLIILFGVLLDLIANTVSPPLGIGPGWWQKQLSLCLALLAVGSPLWLYYWSSVLKQAIDITEWRAVSRRIYLYVIVGASIVALAAGLVNVVYQMLNGVLQNKFGINVLHDAKWSLQVIIAAVPLLWYHWGIVRAEQRRGAEAAAIRKTVTLLITEPEYGLVSRIEDKLGYRVRVLRQMGEVAGPVTEVSEDELTRLIAEIQNAPSHKVFLVIFGGRIAVLPYQDK